MEITLLTVLKSTNKFSKEAFNDRRSIKNHTILKVAPNIICKDQNTISFPSRNNEVFLKTVLKYFDKETDIVKKKFGRIIELSNKSF